MSAQKEILKKVKMIEIKTRKLVVSLFAGEYHSRFKGQGMTFAEFREYVPGDDVRSISWTVTAKTGKTFIKKFDEERELTVLLAVDVSGSADFGSNEYFKGEIIALISSILGFSAIKNNDHVGLLLFSDHIELYVPPKKGRDQIHRIIRDILYFKPKSRGTDIAKAAEHISCILKKRSMIFVISDFMDSGFGQKLRKLGQKHETIALVIEDPAERDLPQMGLVNMHDPETGEMIVVDTASSEVRNNFKRMAVHLKQKRDEELKRSQVDRVEIVVGEEYVNPLMAFFQRRKK